MNSFLLGLLFGIVLFVVVGLAFYFGYRQGKSNKQPIQELNEDDQNEIKRLEDLQKGFVKLMNYDVATALTRKKV
jgi:CHASE3 domain sensor protein